MLLDVRTYTCHPGRLAAQLELYQKYGYPVQLRYMGEPLMYATAESGDLRSCVRTATNCSRISP